jgi:ParB family chromosome partitioning protein
MINVRNISISDIDTGQRLRQIDDGQVESLKESILEIGLLNPITVYAIDENHFGLVAGAHRLEAYRRIGYDEVPASIAELTDLERQLAECDENLCGTHLTPVEEAQFIARRKEVYEAIHPETKHGASLGNGHVEDSSTRERAPRFITDTAAKTGIGERSISKHAERGAKIAPAVMEMIKGTDFDKGVYLDELKRLSPENQLEKAKADLAGPPPARRPLKHLSGATAQIGQGVARQFQPKPEPTYEHMREAILFLADLTPDDFNRLCPANKRAGMFQKLAHLEDVFAKVREGIV